jgi:hypothetical protein
MSSDARSAVLERAVSSQAASASFDRRSRTSPERDSPPGVPRRFTYRVGAIVTRATRYDFHHQSVFKTKSPPGGRKCAVNKGEEYARWRNSGAASHTASIPDTN